MSKRDQSNCFFCKEVLLKKSLVITYLICSLLFTLSVSYLFHREHEERSLEHFNDAVKGLKRTIQNQMASYDEILKDGVSIHESSGHLNQVVWKNAISFQELNTNCPGVREIGMVHLIDPDRLSPMTSICSHTSSISPSYGELSPELFGDPIQRRAIEQARDTGLSSFSGHLTLPDHPNIDAIMYYPVYAKNAPVVTIEEKRNAFIGFLYVSLNMKDVFQSISGEDTRWLEFEIFDTEHVSAKNLLYRFPGLKSHDDTAKHNAFITLDIGGETWSIDCSSTPFFENKTHYDVSLFVGLSGLFLNSLLFLALLAYIEKRELLKKEHKALLKSEHRLETLLSSFADGIHILDGEGNLIDYSDAFIESIGYSDEEAENLRVNEWDCNFSDGELHQILASKIDEERIFETRHRRKDGTVFDVEVTLKPIISEGKNYIYCSSKNITERKKRLEELALFHSLIDESNDMIFIIRMEDGYIEYANKTAEEEIGYTLTEMRAIGVQGFRRPLKEGELFSDHLQELKAAGRLIDHAVIVRKDGNEFLVEAHVRTSHYLGTDYNIAICSDITESEEHKQKLEIMTKELQEREGKLQEINTHLNQRIKEESEKIFEKEKILIQQSKMAAMGEMIGMIAHQWRQPLNAVSAATIKLNMLSKIGVLTPEELYETLTFIQDMSQKMSSTINDFMDFSKPDRKKESVDIKNVFEGIMKIIEAQFTTRSISVTIEIEEGISINTYKHELSHALMNCLSNARDAFENKEIANKAIMIRVYDEEGNVVIEIGDNAGGIEIPILERMFEPFFTTKATDKGTGLGLYMSKKMIEEDLNGTIEVMNKNNGALFIIKLLKIEIG